MTASRDFGSRISALESSILGKCATGGLLPRLKSVELGWFGFVQTGTAIDRIASLEKVLQQGL